MIVLAPKRSTESVVYVFDFTLLLEPTSDTIASFVIAVTSGSATAPVANQLNNDNAVQALVVGGTNGQATTLEVTVTTNLQQVLKRDYSILVSDVLDSLYPSTTTKGQVVAAAFEEIGLAGYEFDVTPDENASALRKLDSLMARLQGPGSNLPLGYNAPAAIGQSQPTDASGIPDLAFEYVGIELALAIMPAIGKTMSAETRQRLNIARRDTRNALTVIPDRALQPSTARGAGAKPWSTWWPYAWPGTGNGP
jgi:P22 tail accessory factor